MAPHSNFKNLDFTYKEGCFYSIFSQPNFLLLLRLPIPASENWIMTLFLKCLMLVQAGGEERLNGLSEFVDHVLCILPFEEEVCISHGVPATFVGHPVLEDLPELNLVTTEEGWMVQGNADLFRGEYRISSVKDLTIVIHVAPNEHVENYIKKFVDEWTEPVVLVPGGSPHTKYDAFSASTVVLCTSGTVALLMQLLSPPLACAGSGDLDCKELSFDNTRSSIATQTVLYHRRFNWISWKIKSTTKGYVIELV
ncbi:hypothetical protein E3N88_04182 [Mikania micrantha]|uniref:lipid-A-disaccharide synthase n=1 Tax=Mikania micrantha TaxID=192012 RepID=A0A5N6PTP0_9ASTR|nr:hypothetical protein E3N88_04182 [Mikania micrantha]